MGKLLAAFAAVLLGGAWGAFVIEGDPASLTSSERATPLKLRRASLFAKAALQDSANWARLEDMAKTIRYTAPLQYQVPLLMSAIHRVLGTSLERFGIDDSNFGLIFKDLHDMSLTDADVGAWVDRIAGLVQNESATGTSLYGAAALSLSRDQAGWILDEIVAIVTQPENSKKLKQEVSLAVKSPEPARYMLHIAQDMIGNTFSKYDITKENLSVVLSHLRSWAAMDARLRPKMDKVMIALGGNLLQ
eukprot:TRINITY_DN4080_c0_g1_i1.p1 TRINITY_DN4080_c0_g1~~TRINITY_DN4080_c0_g1_i1.p1  ORF type:complete len:247 (+),score=38.56 TRINITY_DN4080_c0_g1_i1:73-813(+)